MVLVVVVVAASLSSLFFVFYFIFILLLFRRWRCNQIVQPIPRIGLWPDLRRWIDRAEIRCSRAISAAHYCDAKMEK